MQEQIIVAVFPSRQILAKAIDNVVSGIAADVQKAAVVARSKTGKILVVHDDLGHEEGGLFGAIAGSVVSAIAAAALGAFTLPGLNLIPVLSVGLVLGAVIGWIVGGVFARFVRFGLPRRTVEVVAATLQEGKPALLLRVKDAKAILPRLKTELEPYRVELVEQLRDVVV